MVAVKLEHSNLAGHQASIFKQLQAFRKEGQLCDVVLKSHDGREHRAHTSVLCAASEDLKNMLVGPFQEANQVQQGQPVQMAASDAVVFALLEYIYGEQPEMELEDCFELLRLADAYNFSGLAAAIEDGLCAVVDSAPVTMALKVLQQTQDVPDLKAACEDKVAAHFEMCIDMVDFLEWSPGQLGRILQRNDLKVSREEVVVKGLFNWLNKSKDRGVCLGALLHHVDLRSLSSGNLARLAHLSASMGMLGHDLQREVREALQAHKKRSAANAPDAFRPKRRCLHNFSPELGASSQVPQKVLPRVTSMCWHDGAVYCATFDDSHPCSILRWKPGDTETQTLAGRGARLNGVNDLGSGCEVSVCPVGKILVADCDNRRLLSFENGSGHVVLSDVDVEGVFCSPNGDVYVITQDGHAVERLVGATLCPVISSEHLPAELQFQADDFFVTKDNVIYLSDGENSRVLRLNPGETEPVVVGEAPNKDRSALGGLFVTEEEQIYIADEGQQKVWAFRPGQAAWSEVLACPEELKPIDVLVEGRSLYVGITDFDYDDDDAVGFVVYEYPLPPKLQLG